VADRDAASGWRLGPHSHARIAPRGSRRRYPAVPMDAHSPSLTRYELRARGTSSPGRPTLRARIAVPEEFAEERLRPPVRSARRRHRRHRSPVRGAVHRTGDVAAGPPRLLPEVRPGRGAPVAPLTAFSFDARPGRSKPRRSNRLRLQEHRASFRMDAPYMDMRHTKYYTQHPGPG
jgi:hypothetical protein